MAKYVHDGYFLYCDKGVIPTPFRITEYVDVHVTIAPAASDENKKGLFNVMPFGMCAVKGGQPCMPATNNSQWINMSADVCVGPGEALLDKSQLPCTQGGMIKVAPSFFLALSEMYSDPGEMFDRMVDMLKGTGENAIAFGKGLLGAGWGLIKFVWDVAKFPFTEGWTALTDWDQFTDNWDSRYDSAKEFGEAAWQKGEELYGLATDPDARAAMWAYMSDPDTWEQAFEGVYETISEMDNTEISEFGGQMAFEVLLTVFTGGMGHINKVDKAGDAFRAAQALENLDDFADAGRALENFDDARDAATAIENADDVLPDELIDNLDDGPAGETILGSRMSRITSDPFRPNPNHNYDEFVRQLEGQQDGLNSLTVDDFINNRDDYLANGRSSEGAQAQREFRERALQERIDDLEDSGLSLDDATEQAEEWMSTRAALHDPDQVAGGFGSNVTGMGDGRVNSSLGSQWRTRIDDIDRQVREAAEGMTEAERQSTYLDIELPIDN